ncbi:MAG: hypothetical protein U5L98_13895 [Halomonas sp.]|uniref:hypothetical protein n=1 Tax=Halomonas sp. TaxID=1486246 RepID=UPI002ACE162A|nr:hypothetical protein [Halomonas sp.]MDZ7853692.1 hypothetical protein [Halomonas sp.]
MTHDKKQLLPIDRFLWSLDIVEREGRHLRYSWETLFGSGNVLDSDWVLGLDQHPEEAVRLEAFWIPRCPSRWCCRINISSEFL